MHFVFSYGADRLYAVAVKHTQLDVQLTAARSDYTWILLEYDNSCNCAACLPAHGPFHKYIQTLTTGMRIGRDRSTFGSGMH